MTAYCDKTSLATYLGRDLTDAEDLAAPLACLAATDYIDRYLRQSWQGTTITGEIQTVMRPGAMRDWGWERWADVSEWAVLGQAVVRLAWRPVSSVISVTARAPFVGDTPRVLAAGVGYELLDPLYGTLLVGEMPGTELSVSYVVGVTVPAGISQAAVIIAAAYAVGGSAASGAGRGIQKLKAGSAEITYDPLTAAVDIPATAKELLDAYRPVVTFA